MASTNFGSISLHRNRNVRCGHGHQRCRAPGLHYGGCGIAPKPKKLQLEANLQLLPYFYISNTFDGFSTLTSMWQTCFCWLILLRSEGILARDSVRVLLDQHRMYSLFLLPVDCRRDVSWDREIGEKQMTDMN